MYRTAGIFQGRNLSRIGGKWDFVEKTIVVCSLVQPTVWRPFKTSRRKLTLIGTKIYHNHVTCISQSTISIATYHKSLSMYVFNRRQIGIVEILGIKVKAHDQG